MTQSVGDYLKAIYALAATGAAGTGEIADALGISAAAVSGMLVRLRDEGLVKYEPYRGASLTVRGELEALRLLRRHRLIETFMIDRLGYTWDQVHDEAEMIEHAISDRFTEALAELLGHPSHDPHGDPIPDVDGNLPDTPTTPLAELQTGERLRVAQLRTQETDVLAHLADLGVQPGARISVRAREPLGGLLEVEVEGRVCAVSKELATLIRGEALS